MKTDTLIDMLARNAGPAPRALAARRLSPAALNASTVRMGAVTTRPMEVRMDMGRANGSFTKKTPCQ